MKIVRLKRRDIVKREVNRERDKRRVEKCFIWGFRGIYRVLDCGKLEDKWGNEGEVIKRIILKSKCYIV